MKMSKSLKIGVFSSLALIGGYCVQKQSANYTSEKLSASTDWHLQDLFKRGPVFKVWCQYWVNTFKNPIMIDALLHLLLTDIKTPAFKSDAADFGKDWIAGCV